MKITEQRRTLSVTDHHDVVVCGGGIAGIAAAISAARAGAKTLLIENQYMLGGLATAGLVTIYLPLCDGKGHQVSFGICEELIRLSDALGTDEAIPDVWSDPAASLEDRARKRFRNRYHPNVFAIQCEQLLVKEGVEILYGTRVAQVQMNEGKISHLILENKNGRTAVGVRSVVDATGDSDVCAFAGAPTAPFAHGNNLPSWYYFLKDGKINLKMLGFADKVDEQGNYTTPEGKPQVEHYYTGLDGKENSEMMIASHKALLEHFLQNGELSPSYSPVTIATIPQLRMTRRIVGGYDLDTADEFKEFDTSVGLISNWKKSGPVYEIPFETLYSAAVPNLLCAGRNISVTDAMWDVSRVIPCCAVTGEAAGLAAAMSDDMTALSVTQLQQKLMERKIPLHTKEVL